MIQWMKRLFDTDQYNQTSIRMVDQMGQEGSTQQPFNYRVAVQQFRSWVYAAAHINATAVAATPLRLYVRSTKKEKCLWRTRKISKSRQAYLLGDGLTNPKSIIETGTTNSGYGYRSKVEIIFYLPNFFMFLNKNCAYIRVLNKRFLPENLKFLLLFLRP